MAVIFAGHTRVIHILIVEMFPTRFRYSDTYPYATPERPVTERYPRMAFSDYDTALVTGASTGIGARVVERLAKHGLTVHAVARDPGRLDELARSRQGNILDADAHAVDEQIAVNIQAVLHLVRLILPGMIERDRGHVVNISSIADAFGHRVRVTEIRPSRVETEIFGRLLGDMGEARRQFFEGFDSLTPIDIVDRHRRRHRVRPDTPPHVNIGHIEVLPTLQVPGGLRFERRPR